MGGRGSSWDSDKKPKGGEGKERFSPFGIGDTIPSVGELKKSIGKKGRPYSIDNALKNVNPNHNYEYSEFSENCQRCVIAYELRRRGYNVTALPTYKGDKLPYSTGNGRGIWQKAFRHAKPVRVGATTTQAAQNKVEKQMKSWGKGTRGIIQIPGHVFNCENVNGKIRYVDAQTGTKYSSKDVFGRLTKREAGHIYLTRTDNLRISDRARESVKLLK